MTSASAFQRRIKMRVRPKIVDKVITILIAVAISLIFTFGSSAYQNYKYDQQVKDAISQNVSNMVGQYLQSYLNSDGAKAQIKSVFENSDMALSDEQMKQIIAAASKEVEEAYASLIKNGLTDRQIEAIEARIYSNLDSKISNIKTEAVITDAQKRELTTTVLTLVEAGIADQMKSSNSNAEALERAVNKNVTNITNNMQNSGQKIKDLEKYLQELQTKYSTSTSSTTKTIEEQSKELNELRTEYLKTTESLLELCTILEQNTTTLGDSINTLRDALGIVSDHWSSSTAYRYGDFCIFDDTLYRSIWKGSDGTGTQTFKGIKPVGDSNSATYWKSSTIANEIPTFRLEGDKLYITTPNSVID